MSSITVMDEFISEVDTYLLNLFSITDDKSNNGNNGNNSGGNNGNSNAGNNGNGSDNSNKNPGDNSSGNNSNSNNNGNGSGNNGNGNGNNGNGNNSGNQSDNGKNTDNGNNSENGNGNSNAWKDNGAKVDQEKADGKTKDHANKGYDKNTNANGKGYANGKNKDKSNNGKYVGWDKNDNPNTPNDPYDMINPDIFEFTGYINDINQEYTEVLMTTDSEGNYRGAYTYANGERISVEDLGQVQGVPNDPLYYLYDALGTTAAITNMNAGIIDNNRFAPFGEPISPVAKNSRLTNSPWGYTGESHDIEAGLVYLRARYYEPGTGRFIQQDTYPFFGEIEEPLTRNLYIYGNGNPLKYTDPSGHFALIPYLVKAAAKGLINGVTDLLLQVAMNYYFNPTTQGSLKASFGEVNWYQVARSGVEGFVVPWEKGNKLARAALSAAGDVLTNALNDKNYTEEKALIDFGVGFVGDLAGGALGEIIAKYGAKPVANGLKMIGFSESDIKKFTGITVDSGPSPGTVTNVTSKTGTVWDNIVSTAKDLPNTNIPTTFQVKIGNRTLWANANATEHMGEYIGRFGAQSWTIETRSQAMLSSFYSAVKEAMSTWSSLPVGRQFGTFGGWELGINTETGVIYHALMK